MILTKQENFEIALMPKPPETTYLFGELLEKNIEGKTISGIIITQDISHTISEDIITCQIIQNDIIKEIAENKIKKEVK